MKVEVFFLCHKIFVEQAGKEMQKVWKLGSFDVPAIKTKWPCFVFVAVQPSIISPFSPRSGIESRIPISTVSPMKDPWLIVVHPHHPQR